MGIKPWFWMICIVGLLGGAVYQAPNIARVINERSSQKAVPTDSLPRGTHVKLKARQPKTQPKTQPTTDVIKGVLKTRLGLGLFLVTKNIKVTSTDWFPLDSGDSAFTAYFEIDTKFSADTPYEAYRDHITTQPNGQGKAPPDKRIGVAYGNAGDELGVYGGVSFVYKAGGWEPFYLAITGTSLVIPVNGGWVVANRQELTSDN